MPKFLTQEEVYSLLQREMPEDAYASGQPDAYFTTADLDATAAAVASGYLNLERIYDNYFPQTADEKLPDWQIKVFGEYLPSGLTNQEIRDRILTKLRQQQGMRPADMKDITLSVIGSDKEVEIWEWGSASGTWVLDESELDITTILGSGDGFVYGPDLCGKTAAELGITQEDLDELREDAYTYEVRIYNYTLTSLERETLDRNLNRGEPARSQHVITDGLTDADKLGGDT